VVDLLAGGQGVFNILPLSDVVRELEAAIVEIAGAQPPAVERPGTHPAAQYLAANEAAGR